MQLLAGVEDFARELAALRHGRGLQSARLRARVGPRISAVCGIQSADSDRVVKQRLSDEFRGLASDLPPDLRLTIDVALAIDPRAQHRHLKDRIDWLAGELHCGTRTARRRVADAFERLAEAAVQRSSEGDRPADPETGWYLRRVKSLLRLDTPTPELYEERTVVATRDNLKEIWVRFSLPRHRAGCAADHELIADVLQGARIEGVERLGDTHFRFALALPRMLRQGEQLEYTMVYRVPEDQPMRSHYAYLPLIPCESFHLRARFDPGRPPVAVWRLDRLAPRLLDEEPPDRDHLPLDDAGELTLEFTGLTQGFGYGVAWRHTDNGESPGCG